MPEPHELAATLTQDIVDAIGKTLAAAMETAVRNGADSRSMPDEYVTLAAWLSGVKPRARRTTQSRRKGVLLFLRLQRLQEAQRRQPL